MVYLPAGDGRASGVSRHPGVYYALAPACAVACVCGKETTSA